MLQQSFLIVFFLIISCDTNSSDEITGCTDNNACNYDSAITENDGSCQYLDCLGDCGGGLELDVCNVCDGSGECDCNNGTSSCSCCCEGGEILDCFGVCDGGDVLDDCGICNGDGSTCAGCTDNNACNYDSSATENDGSCQYLDCLGECDGGLEFDVCNVCDGSGECDCNNGTSSCSCCCEGGEILDCFGVCDGGDVLDDCGICNGDGTTCNNENEQLNIITWNLLEFPNQNNNTVDTLSHIINDLDVDILALQEIIDEPYLEELTNNLGENWEYYISYNGYIMKLAYLVNSNDVIVNNDYTILDEYSSDYFGTRSPYVLNISYDNQNYKLINVHYKAFDGNEDIRLMASTLLEEYISINYEDEKILVLGDFNDLLIDNPNVFEPFLSKPNEYEFADYTIASGSPYNWSYPDWPSHIDHILITNELFSNYESVETLLIDNIYFDDYSDYESLVSDHRPLLIIIY